MTTDGAGGARPQISFDGVLLLDKPAGMSSNGALQAVRRLFGRVKAGHTGTLDPIATGLLPVCLGQATKFAAGLLEADKIYDGVIRLGVATTTGDSQGEPIAQASAAGCLERLPSALAAFVGEIEQLPPMFSAIKHRGRPLYRYARAGQSVERTARRVKVHALELISASGVDVSVRVRCSKGTYIRSLAHDIGMRLGCGAHLRALRRVGIGRLRIEEAVPLDELAALSETQRLARLRPADILLCDLPAVVLDRSRAQALLQGRAVGRVAAEPLGCVRLYDEEGLFLGLGAGAADVLAPKRMRAPSVTGAAVAAADVT